MRKYMQRFTFLFRIVIGIVLIPNMAVAAENVVVGVNLVNGPDRLTPSEQDTILSAMKNAGVRVIRAGIDNSDKSLEFAQRVYAHGIKIEWFAWGIPSSSGNMILSTADPEKFRAYFQPMLAKLESKGIVLAGMELGNEINWSNHDLGQSGTGRILGLDDLSHDPKGQQVAKGYIQYVKLLAVLKDIRDHSQLNQRTPIISAGSGELDGNPSGRDAVSLRATIQFLRANGIGQLCGRLRCSFLSSGKRDHRQSGSPVCNETSPNVAQPVVAENHAGSRNGDCLSTAGKSCPVNDDNRIRIFSELRNDFSQLAQQGRLKGILLYTWQGDFRSGENNPYAAFICGAVTRSGRLAIAPL